MTLHQGFTIPPPAETAELRMADGAMIRLRRYGRSGGTRLVLSHGNGLAIGAYAPFWLPLAQDYDVVVFDMRNHGENPLHRLDGHTWANFASDIEEIFHGTRNHFGPARTVAAVHSLASVATLKHALAYPGRWDAICAFDPPIMPPAGHPLHNAQQSDMARLSARAARRQRDFDNPDELAAQFRRAPAFGAWVPEGADLMARHTLRRLPGGRWTLCCPPEYEADVFRKNIDPKPFGRLGTISAPIRIIAGDPAALHASPAASIAQSAHEMFEIDYTMVPGTTHFLQFEQPRACRDLLIDFLKRHGLS